MAVKKEREKKKERTALPVPGRVRMGGFYCVLHLLSDFFFACRSRGGFLRTIFDNDKAYLT